MARKTEQTWIRASLTALCLLLATSLMAEDELEYRMEIGGGMGTCFYLGDANHTPFAHMSGMGGVIVRRMFNPRMAVKANVDFGHIGGNTDGFFIPKDGNDHSSEGGQPVKLSFQRNVFDLGAQFEMNFWGYGTGQGYKENSRITPYAVAGAGVTLAMGGGAKTAFGLCMPIGVGMKFKVRPRLNIGAEWTMRFTTSDNLDSPSKDGTQLEDPYGIKSSGMKNKDSYSFLMFFLTYDISPKYRRCNN